jgi:hypothetical protein
LFTVFVDLRRLLASPSRIALFTSDLPPPPDAPGDFFCFTRAAP